MNAGTFEYHQWPMGSTLGKIQEYATSSAAASGERVETGKVTAREMIEQVAVVVKADATIKEVATPRDALGINVADRADHQVERQPKIRAELRQRPEYRRTAPLRSRRA